MYNDSTLEFSFRFLPLLSALLSDGGGAVGVGGAPTETGTTTGPDAPASGFSLILDLDLLRRI